jgi:hypothetical protein
VQIVDGSADIGRIMCSVVSDESKHIEGRKRVTNIMISQYVCRD